MGKHQLRCLHKLGDYPPIGQHQLRCFYMLGDFPHREAPTKVLTQVGRLSPYRAAPAKVHICSEEVGGVWVQGPHNVN